MNKERVGARRGLEPACRAGQARLAAFSINTLGQEHSAIVYLIRSCLSCTREQICRASKWGQSSASESLFRLRFLVYLLSDTHL